MHQKPAVDTGDKDCDIYEGEQISIHESEFDVDEEFVEVEELTQSLGSSKRTSMAIREAASHEESSTENPTKPKNVHPPAIPDHKQVSIPIKTSTNFNILDYLPPSPPPHENKLKIPSTNMSGQKGTRFYPKRANINVTEDYEINDNHAMTMTVNRMKYESPKYNFSSIDKNSVSPDTFTSHNRNYLNPNSEVPFDEKSSVKINSLGGDQDSLSLYLKKRNYVSQ